MPRLLTLSLIFVETSIAGYAMRTSAALSVISVWTVPTSAAARRDSIRCGNLPFVPCCSKESLKTDKFLRSPSLTTSVGKSKNRQTAIGHPSADMCWLARPDLVSIVSPTDMTAAVATRQATYHLLFLPTTSIFLPTPFYDLSGKKVIYLRDYESARIKFARVRKQTSVAK